MPRLGSSTWNWSGLKKVRDQPLIDRQAWINRHDEVAVVRQCMLAGIARSTVYSSKVVKVHEYELL
ncbi:MAG: hypothetical protein QX198_15085 [Methylococcaceae bacterium]